MIIWVYDRWGTQINCLKDVISFAHDDEIGALDFIEFECFDATLEKGDYLVWRDEFGEWHEFIIRSATQVHTDGLVTYSVYAVNSISELTLSYINERDSYNYSNVVALQKCIQDTRWLVGKVDDLGNNDIKFYHTTVYDGISDIIEKWGGELSTSVQVSSNGVYNRYINIQKQRGSDYGLLFTYGFDADSIERVVDLDDVYTRVHVFGKGEETETGGYGRRLTFADINGGKDYVEDNDAMQKWGVIGKNGQKQHAEGAVIFENCEDKEELLQLGKDYLNQVKVPRITYSAKVAILADAGMDFKNARAGDICHIRDKELDERLTGRIVHVRRYPFNAEATEITLGNITRTISEVFKDQQSKIDSLNQRASTWDEAAGASGSWLENMQKNLNDYMNATGGYVYWEPGEGITVYDRPEDQNPTMAIQIKGGSFRIANSKLPNGEWDWKTFGTGDGFTADVINAGILRAGDNYINLDDGTINFNNGSIHITSKVGKVTYTTDISPDTGFIISKDNEFIGGIEVVGNECWFRASRVGARSYAYITTGLTDSSDITYWGASFHCPSANGSTSGNVTYLEVTSSYNTADKAQQISGTLFNTRGKYFLSSSTYSLETTITAPVKTEPTEMSKDVPYLCLNGENKTAVLKVASYKEFYVTTGGTYVNHASTCYAGFEDGGVTITYGGTPGNSNSRYLQLGSDRVFLLWGTNSGVYIDSSRANFQYNASRYLNFNSNSVYLVNGNVSGSGNMQVYMTSSGCGIQWHNSSGLFINSGAYYLQWSSTRYLAIGENNISFVIGSKQAWFNTSGWHEN